MTEDKPYTYDDLEKAVLDYNYSKTALANATSLLNTHQAAVESHRKTVDAAEQMVYMRKLQIRKIIDKLEK